MNLGVARAGAVSEHVGHDMSSLCRSRGDHVAAAPELSLRSAADNPNRFAETAASAGVNRLDDAHVLGQDAMAGIRSGQQRNNLDDPLFSDFRRLPAVRPAL